MNETSSPKADSFKESIEHLSCDDFDGHTEFAALGPEQRLMWLSQTARFYFEHCFREAATE